MAMRFLTGTLLFTIWKPRAWKPRIERSMRCSPRHPAVGVCSPFSLFFFRVFPGFQQVSTGWKTYFNHFNRTTNAAAIIAKNAAYAQQQRHILLGHSDLQGSLASAREQRIGPALRLRRIDAHGSHQQKVQVGIAHHGLMAWLVSTLGISLGYSLSREITISRYSGFKRTQKTII